MRDAWKLLFALPLLMACGRDPLPEETPLREDGLYHEMIRLGEKLDDPYTVENIKSALSKVYPTKAGEIDIQATDLYVRFLPKDDAEFEALTASGLYLLDHPMDYRILREGDYYQDPSVGEEAITWQYAVVSRDFVFPESIQYEVLDECYISENDPVTRASSGIDWEAVEAAAYELTGNADLWTGGTRAGEEAAFPSGRITIEDPEKEDKPFGVAGVRVTCNSFVKFASGYTDRDGYYTLNKKFSSKPRYRLEFRNEKGFSIGMNLILMPASVSTLGEGGPGGIDSHITRDSEGKLFRRCVVNNAAYEYFSRCTEADMDILPPPGGLRFWILNSLDCSSSVMMHQGAVISHALIAGYLGPYALLVKLFLPDITIGTKDRETYARIYSATMHELAHSSHYAQVGNTYWNNYVQYIIESYVTQGQMAYGTGDGDRAGYCEVGEMWGYFLESVLYQDRYGGGLQAFGSSFWFYPQIFRYLYQRGMTRGEIFRALKSEVTSRDDLMEQLIDLYPDRESLIRQVFERYHR